MPLINYELNRKKIILAIGKSIEVKSREILLEQKKIVRNIAFILNLRKGFPEEIRYMFQKIISSDCSLEQFRLGVYKPIRIKAKRAKSKELEQFADSLLYLKEACLNREKLGKVSRRESTIAYKILNGYINALDEQKILQIQSKSNLDEVCSDTIHRALGCFYDPYLFDFPSIENFRNLYLVPSEDGKHPLIMAKEQLKSLIRTKNIRHPFSRANMNYDAKDKKTGLTLVAVIIAIANIKKIEHETLIDLKEKAPELYKMLLSEGIKTLDKHFNGEKALSDLERNFAKDIIKIDFAKHEVTTDLKSDVLHVKAKRALKL